MQQSPVSPDAQPVEIEVIDRLSEVSPEMWTACAAPETEDGGRPCDPFTTYAFLKALEDSRSVGVGTGWQPAHLLARAGGQVIGVAPMYAKSHSQGEYIFDHAWAHAYERAGGRYYPKMQIAVPFTPATGRRFLARPGHETLAFQALAQGAVQVAARHGMSSLHVTFCTQQEAEAGAELGLMHRRSQQFHWVNQGYGSFDDFLSALSSRKRKTIRKERRTAQGFGGRIHVLTGDDIRPEHWDAVWMFYQNTGARKWGTPYLTRAAFDLIGQTMADDVLLVLAERDGIFVAGAMNMIGRETLFGRYWGMVEHHDCMHFEACYYQAIEFAIEHGLSRVEAGAQGEHKLARGYMPVTTHSLHWIGDPGFAEAVADYLAQEARAVDEEIEILTSYGPFRQTDHPDEQD